MIYVIRSAAVVDESIPSFEFILKIGYCRDDREKTRTAIYITENPTIKTLFTIPGGTEQDEKNLHHHFRKYLKYGNEWFSYNQEILDFFTTHTIKESLGELDLHLSQTKLERIQRDINSNFLRYKQKYINPVLHTTEKENYIPVLETLVNNLYNLASEEEIDKYFKQTYPEIDFTDDNNILSERVINLVNLILNVPSKFEYRMKFIYSLDMDRNVIIEALENLEEYRFLKYYLAISKEKAGALKYQSGYLENECRRLYSDGDYSSIFDDSREEKIKDKIYDLFSIGEKYTKLDIKERLRNLYLEIKCDKTPKASDLEQYFEIKECKVTVSTGKQENGFKIIKKKEED